MTIKLSKQQKDMKVVPALSLIKDRYGYVDHEAVSTLIAGILLSDEGGTISFQNEISYSQSCLRWHNERSADPLGVAKISTPRVKSEEINLTEYLSLQHPNNPEIDAVIHVGSGGIIAISVVGQQALEMWDGVIAPRLLVDNYPEHIIQHTPLGKEFIYLFRTDSTVDFNRLPSAATIWGDSENRVTLLLHSCTVALPGSREFHTGIGQVQLPAGRWGAAASMRPHEISIELAYVLHLLQHDSRDAERLYKNLIETCAGLGSETKDQILREWSNRHSWEKIFTKLKFSRLTEEPECHHVGCGVWSPDPKSSLKITAHTSTCARAMRGMPCIDCDHTGSGHPLEASAIKQHERFNPGKPLPKKFRMKMLDVIAVLFYNGNWKKTYTMEGISLPDPKDDRKDQ